MESPLTNNPSLSGQNSPSRRLDFLDNLKTFIILLVVGFHASYAYSIYLSQDWYVVDPQKSLFYDVFILSAFAFMMPVMFFIAGYFGIHSLARKGQPSFWRDKFYRIVIPWGLGVVFLAPAIGYIHSVSRNLYPPYLSYWAHYFFGKEYQTHGQVHFYFLGMLTLYYLALSVAYRIHKPLGHVSSKPTRVSRGLFILFGLATGIVFFCGNLFIDEGLWVKIGVFDLPATRFIPYMGYFFLGVFAYKQQWFTASGYTPKLKGWVPMCVISFILFTTFLNKGIMPERIRMVFYALSYFFFCLTAVFSLLAFFQKRLNFTTKLLSNLSANSYAIYFIHYLVVVLIILAFRGFQWNVFIKHPLVWILSVIVSYLISKYVLSKTPMFGGTVKRIPAKS
jgi:glucan biosynthesis protein C